MPNVFITSDLHLRHRKIVEYEPYWERFATVEDRDQWIEEIWRATVGKRDVVYILGDVAMNRDGLALLSTWPGKKKLIMGNHDTLDMRAYLGVFTSVRAYHVFDKRILASHVPVHPGSLRPSFDGQVHGHTHGRVLGGAYVNACMEACDGRILTLQDVYDRIP